MSIRRDLAWTGGAQALVAILQVILQMALARLLPLGEFGALASAYATYAIAEALLLNRGAELAQREIGRLWVLGAFGAAKREAHRIKKRDFRIITLGAALLALASPVLARAFDFDPLPLALLAVGLPLQSGYGSSKAILISAARFDVQARLEFGFILIQVAAGIAGAFLAGSLGYAVGLVIAAVGKTVLAARASHSVWPEDIDGETEVVAGMTPNGDAARLETQTTMRTALLLLAQQADLLLIGSLLGRDSVALYRAAKSIAGIPGRAAAPVWSVIRPRLLRAWHAEDRATVRRLVLQPAAVFLSAAAVLSPALLFFAGSGLAYLYGAHFAAARVELLLLLAGTWCSTAVSGWFAYWTVIAGRLGLATGLAALQLGLTAAGALLAPTHGTPAVAAAASMAMVLSALLGWVALYRSTAAPRSA